MKSEDIYRIILTRMWGDEKFNRLSSPPPSGKYLWIFLLTGPFSNRIGLFRAGEMTLSEELGWDPKGFREAFGEVLLEGLVKVSSEYSKDRLIFIPNFIKINPPQNPNVIKDWHREWNILPECELKLEAWHHIKSIIEQKDKESKAWSKAFIETCRKPSIKASQKASTKPCHNHCPNQEQEQEQEQEQKKNTLVDSQNCEVDLPVLWKTHCPSLPQIRELTRKRKDKIKARLKEHPDLAWWMHVFSLIEASDFCKGNGSTGWKATFDWIIENSDNAVKVIEGKYSNIGGSHVASIQGNGQRPKTFREIDEERDRENRRNYLKWSGLLPDEPSLDAGLSGILDLGEENA